MTPERKKYIAKCGNREMWLRSAIYDTKRKISCQKQRISNANEKWIKECAECELWHQKQLLKTLRHELARLKGMGRVVVPKDAYTRKYLGIGTCACGFELDIKKHDYCPSCGTRMDGDNQ